MITEEQEELAELIAQKVADKLRPISIPNEEGEETETETTTTTTTTRRPKYINWTDAANEELLRVHEKKGIEGVRDLAKLKKASIPAYESQLNRLLKKRNDKKKLDELIS